MTRTLDDIIDDLGGEIYVATECDCGVAAISNWKRRGLPRGRWIDLIKLAGRVGKVLTLDEIEAADAQIARAETV